MSFSKQFCPALISLSSDLLTKFVEAYTPAFPESRSLIFLAAHDTRLNPFVSNASISYR